MSQALRAWTLAVAVAALTDAAWSQPRLPHSPSDQEVALLPEECKILLRGTAEQKSAFYRQFPGLVGPNHFCWGMNFMNRAKFSSLNRTERRFNIQSAIGEFNYVLRHSAPDATGLDHVRRQKELAETMLKIQ